MQKRFKVSVQRTCDLALLQRSVWYAKSTVRDQSGLRQRIRDIAMSRPRFGYPRVLVMLKREGWQVGKTRVYRLNRLEGLQLRMKVRRRKRIALLRGKPQIPTGPNQHWSMDFVHDQMADGRAFRILTVIDQWSRESVCLEANFRQSGGASRRPWTALVHSGVGPRPSPWITARSSLPNLSMTGRIAVGSSSTIRGPANPLTMA